MPVGHCSICTPSLNLQGGCIIRAGFLNDIKAAYKRDIGLRNLLVDPFFQGKLVECEQDWRKVVSMAIMNGVAAPGMTASIAYFDTYKRDRLPANLVQVHMFCGLTIMQKVLVRLHLLDSIRQAW